jgi:hypothetical protein
LEEMLVYQELVELVLEQALVVLEPTEVQTPPAASECPRKKWMQSTG